MIWTLSKLIPNLSMGDLNRQVFKQAAQMADQHKEGGSTSLASVRDNPEAQLPLISKQLTKAGKATEKLHSSYTAGRTGTVITENSPAIPQKVKPRANIQPHNSTLAKDVKAQLHKSLYMITEDHQKAEKPMSIS